MDSDDDPVVSSYDVFLTDSEVSRYVFQYLDRPKKHPYIEGKGQKPTEMRLKPRSGLVEVDIPISIRQNYDINKGARYGEAMKKSRASRDGGAYGMAGGFSSGNAASSGSRVKSEGQGDIEILDNKKVVDSASIIKTQPLGGRIKPPEEGDPVYMLATFKDKNLHLSPVSAVVQLHPQLHHQDAMEEIPKGRGTKTKKDDDERPAESEARTIDVKIKAAEDGEQTMLATNLDLLKKMQDEKWKSYEWIDAETEEAWYTYENYMTHQQPEDLPQLESAIQGEEYLDAMSAPRIDPAHPEMTGWAMKQNRQKQKDGVSGSEDEAG
ncbi:uncharacterized protein PFLUO_LOCUS7667 [Penicillium psychrofluorescens]|uniref:uncharacterized protein n=1 Tax=Penicillium psychrofluorescens TaxID=3158075 RepID=UPI003CCD7017